MTRVALALGAAVALMPMGAVAEDAHSIVQASTVKWGPPPPSVPKGSQIAVLDGDPGKEGPFIVRLKFPAGYKVPPHMHPADENITVLSGTVNLGTGDKLDPKKSDPVKPGGFWHMPKGMHHFVWTSGEAILQISGMGPFTITYVNPADDPRNAKK